MKKIVTAVACAGLLFTATACSGYNDERGMGDAPVAGKSGEDSPKYVTNNPDGFGNVVTGCVYGAQGWRYFATTKGGRTPSNLVVLKDESC